MPDDTSSPDATPGEAGPTPEGRSPWAPPDGGEPGPSVEEAAGPEDTQPVERTGPAEDAAGVAGEGSGTDDGEPPHEPADPTYQYDHTAVIDAPPRNGGTAVVGAPLPGVYGGGGPTPIPAGPWPVPGFGGERAGYARPLGAPPAYPPPYGGIPGYRHPGAPPYGMPYPGPMTAPFPPVRAPSRRTGVLVAVMVISALLAGLVGGAVGFGLAGRNRSGPSVLGQPLPEIDKSAVPLSPVEAVAEKVLPSVVQLRVEGVASAGEGSGMVLSPDGLMLTNNHVVEAGANGGSVTAVFQDGTTAPARIIGRDPSSDLAVLRAEGVNGLTPIELGNSESVRVGQQVVAFGSPLGLGGTVTTGIISAQDRAVNVGKETGANSSTVLNALQTDAAINPGNSGGPLVDMQGRVIGINSAIATTSVEGGSIGVGFSIPINQAKRVAEELERTGKATRAVLGVSVDNDRRRAGALIRSVIPGGAAEQAGIKQGDLVVRIGDQRISTGTDLQAAVSSRAPGEVIEVQLADRTVQATLAAAPG